jgi:hypothetical protein
MYNAAKQVEFLKQTWPEMEKIMSKHVGVLFAGKLPEKEKEFISRFCICFGYSPRHAARDFRGSEKPHKLIHNKTRGGPVLAKTKATDVFRPYFDNKQRVFNPSLEGRTPLEEALYQLEAMIEAEKVRGSSKPKAHSKRQFQNQLTPIQLLEHIRDFLPESI